MDRWRWLKQRLPVTANGESLLDIGCGTGAFTIGAARRGYKAVGLSWDERNQHVASDRAKICRATNATFEVCDVRRLGERTEFHNQFDVALCLETIEHILDDFKLVQDISRCLKPGGRLLLTSPNYYYQAITSGDNGPFVRTETGWHVRRGYTLSMLQELCQCAGLLCEEVSYLSGWLSQIVTKMMRGGARIHSLVGWGIVLPFRPLVPMVDTWATPLMGRPWYSIGLCAYRPRFGQARSNAEGSCTAPRIPSDSASQN